MIENDDELDLDELMRRIRDEVEKRRAIAGAALFPSAGAQAPPAPRTVGDGNAPLVLGRFVEARPSFEVRDRYRVDDFLEHHDEAFVANVYRGVLRRGPDGAGLASFLDPLRRGEISKIEVLGRIRYSPEGRAARVPVEGLAWRYALKTATRIPIVGPALAIAQYVARLPQMAANHQRLEGAWIQRDAEVRRQLDANASVIERSVEALDARVSALKTTTRDDIASKADAGEMRALGDRLASKADVSELRSLDRTLASKADLGELRALRESVGRKADATSLASLAERLDQLIRTAAARGDVETLRAAIDALRSALDALQSVVERRVPADFYRALEDRFRGTRKDILQRMELYVPIISGAGAGTEQSPVLDLGCGRGEWLEVLASHGLVGRGVDASPAMIETCRERGLPVTEGDALEHLRSLAPGSVGAVTAMHVVEHVPFSGVLSIVDEAMRILRAGGVLLLETPNPENLEVGANTFYIDPTHRHPIPPSLLEFAIVHRGFAPAEVLRMRPRSASDGTATPTGIEPLDRALFGPQDYAIVAYKPDHAAR